MWFIIHTLAFFFFMPALLITVPWHIKQVHEKDKQEAYEKSNRKRNNQ